MEEVMNKVKGKKKSHFLKIYANYYDLTYHENKFYGYKEREDVIEQELSLCGYYAIVTSKKNDGWRGPCPLQE